MKIAGLGISVLLVLSAVLLIAGPSIVSAFSCTTTYSASSYSSFTPISISSPGTDCFGAGTYNTQITITASNVVLTTAPGVKPGLVIIQPSSVASTSTVPASAAPSDPDAGDAEYSIILVDGVTGVTISNLVVDGSALGAFFVGSLAPCVFSYEFIGVLFLTASGSITGSTVQNILLPASLPPGCVEIDVPGQGIAVQTASGHSSSVVISNDQVHNYNKNGITCRDVGTTCTITKNTVSFSPSLAVSGITYSSSIAVNGIEISYGAVGYVTGNTVSGNECNEGGTPPACGPEYIYEAQSAGIITYESSAGTTLKGNTLYGNDVGILDTLDAVTSMNNVVQSNRYEGVYMDDGTYTASGNSISGGNIGLAVVADGFASSPTTVALTGNDFNGYSLSVPAVQATAFTGGTYGGTNSEPVYLTINGFSETITPGLGGNLPYGTPPLGITFVNIP